MGFRSVPGKPSSFVRGNGAGGGVLVPVQARVGGIEVIYLFSPRKTPSSPSGIDQSFLIFLGALVFLGALGEKK